MQMKKATVISVGLHAAVMLWAVVSFSSKSFEATPTESLPVDFISEKDFTQMTKGVKDAPKPDKPKPFVEKKADEPKPVEDTKAKVSEKPEIKPVAEKKPEPPPEPKPEKEQKEEKKAEASPQKPPEPEATKKADPIADKLQKENERKLPKVTKQVPPRRPQPQKQQPKFDANKIAALLDQREPRRLASAGDVLNSEATLGRAKGSAAQLSQSEIDALRERIKQCWTPPVGAADAQDLQVVFRVLFRVDGSVMQGPDVVQGPPSAQGPVFAESARRAILQCQPYTMLHREHYAQWKDIELGFNLRDMFH